MRYSVPPTPSNRILARCYVPSYIVENKPAHLVVFWTVVNSDLSYPFQYTSMLFRSSEEPEMGLQCCWLGRKIGSCTEKTSAPSLET